MIAGLNFLVDVQHFTIKADYVSPSLRKRSGPADDAELFGDVFFRIAKDWVIQIQFLGKRCVVFHGITAGREVGNIEFFNSFAVRTERQAFFGSATGEGFGEPGNDDCLFALKF